MHRHARPGVLLIVSVLVLLAGAMSLAGPATAFTGAAPPAVALANIASHPAGDDVAHEAAPVTQHLTAPPLFGLLAETAQPPASHRASGGAHPRHHGPAAQEAGPRQVRAPPAITDR